MGECVGHDILESGDVGDVRRELADKSDLMPLPIWDGFLGLEEGTGQGLLVREDLESAAFEKVEELQDCAINCEKFKVVRWVTRFGRRGTMAEEPQGLDVAVDDLMDRARNGPGARVRVDAQSGVGDWVELPRGVFFVWVKADVIDSFQVSWQGAPARASVSGRIVAALLGRKWQ